MEVPAYGLADAEAQVEKELRDALPEATVEILDIRRVDGGRRIVETFLVSYRVRLEREREVEGPGEATAIRECLRQVRVATHGTRFHRIAWEARSRAPR